MATERSLRKLSYFVDNLRQDLRYAGRVLRRSPGFTAIATLTLAVGIGGITTIFSVVNGVILRPLPYGHADSLVIISEVRTGAVNARTYVRPPKDDWPERTQVLDGLAELQYAPFTFMDGRDAPVVIGARVSANYFSLLQTQPRMGRRFNDQDEKASEPSAAIVTHGFWQSRLGGDPNVLGQILKFSEQGSIAIIGVMPANFRAPVYWDAEIFTPVTRVQGGGGLVGRLKAGVTAEQAESAVNAAIKEGEAARPPGNGASRVAEVRPLQPVDPSNRALLLLLFGSVAFLLLMAIANIANLMLSRTLTREREIALRSAIGASRRRLIRQLMTESLLLSGLGGSLGVVSAYAATTLLVSWMPQGFPRMHEIDMDPVVAGFVLGITILSSIGFGVFPALAFSRPDLQQALRGSTHQASESPRNRYLRQAFVALEIGLAVVLLMGATLSGKSFWNLVNVQLGFEPANVYVARINLLGRYRGAAEGALLRNDLIERMLRHSEVESANMVDVGPVFSGRRNGLWLEGRTERAAAPVLDTQVTSAYFQTLRVPFIRGEVFKDGDLSAVVNDTFVKFYWPDSNPIGKRLRVGPETNPGPWLTVSGVVRDQKSGLTRPAAPQIFRSCQQCGHLFVRARNRSAGVATLIRSELGSIDSSLIITNLESMEVLLSQDTQILDSRLRSALFIAFGAAGLLLAFAGVYGVASYSAAQRTREVGVRMALGATHWNVLRSMVAQSMLPVVIGIGFGVAAASALAGLLRNYLFEVTPTDTGIFVGVPVFLAVIAITANLIPASRACRVDPIAALRQD